MATASVKAVITAEDKASAVLKNFAGNVENIGSRIANTMKRATELTVAAASGAALFGLKTAGDLESARQGFATLLGSAEQADEVIAQIKRDAAQTPFELKGLIEANQALTAVTKNGGRSESILLDVGKALAAAGKGQPELDRMIGNLQQIGLTGKITEMDVRQFGMAGINILELLADYYGTTTDKAGEMVKDSKDAFGDLEKAFAKAGDAGGKFEFAFKNQAGTFNQLLSNMKDSLVIFASDFVKQTGLFDKAKEAMRRFTDAINNNKDAIVNITKNAMRILRETISKLAEDVIRIATAVSNYLTPKFRELWESIQENLIPVLVNLWQDVIKPLIPVIGVALVGAIGLLVDTARILIDVFVPLGKKIYETLSSVIEKYAMPSLSALYKTIQNNLMPSLRHLYDAFKRIWEAINPAFIETMKFLSKVMGVAVVAAIWLLINGLNLAFKAFGYIIDIVANVIGWLANIIKMFGEVTVSAGHLVGGVIDWFSKLPGRIGGIISDTYNGIMSWFGQLPHSIGTVLNTIHGYFASLPQNIGNVIWGVVGTITAPFKEAFNTVVWLWNNTVGRIGFSAPEWVPGFGGKGWNMPTFGYMAKGGRDISGGLYKVGEEGAELVSLPDGSNVYTANETRAMENQQKTSTRAPVMSGNTTINIAPQIGMFMGSPSERRKLAMQILEDLRDIANQQNTTVSKILGANRVVSFS